MRFFVGVTDNDWFNYLAARRPDEVNFWKPGTANFKALAPGELLLFKLHSPLDFIAGGGYFVRFSRLPLSLAWLAFETKNGVPDQATFRRVIQGYRRDATVPDPEIGCIVLTEPFFWPRELWIPAPFDWHRSVVQGKGYDTQTESGRALWREVQARVAARTGDLVAREPTPIYGSAADDIDPGPRYRERLAKLRIGQGGFRVLVTEAYERRCAITGEKTLPVLEAAHIKPYSKEGPHAVSNGLLLRADMHILFDNGYLTITPDLHIEVSKNIQQQFTNGKLYYSYHGQSLRSLPQAPDQKPAAEYLRWHNEHCFAA